MNCARSWAFCATPTAGPSAWVHAHPGPGTDSLDPEHVERPYAPPTSEQQMQILRRLNAAEAFETFLQTKYVGQKRFS